MRDSLFIWRVFTFLSVFNRFEHDLSMIDTKNFFDDSFFNDFNFSSRLKRLFCVFLNDELILKRFSSLIYSSLCQIACLVEIESDASRCFEFWSKCVNDLYYCETNKLNINIDLSCIEELRRKLNEKQIIENVFKFFHVQIISIESFEKYRFVD